MPFLNRTPIQLMSDFRQTQYLVTKMRLRLLPVRSSIRRSPAGSLGCERYSHSRTPRNPKLLLTGLPSLSKSYRSATAGK